MRANWEIFSENGKAENPPPIWKVVPGVIGAVLVLGIVIVWYQIVGIVGGILSGGLIGVIGLVFSGLGSSGAGGGSLFDGGGGASGDW